METVRSLSYDVQVGNVRVLGGLCLAPMAGTTNLVFRLLCRRFGAGLTITEMVSAKGLILGNGKTLHYLDRDPMENPVAAQIFGTEPHVMAEAACRVEESGFHMVDINMGCPVPKITNEGGGCALMKEPSKAAAIVSAVVEASSIPVTVKIRAGWSKKGKNAPEVARALEDAGASAITVHARTREQKYSGKADWELIGAVKQAISIPVFGNGDIRSPQMAAELMRISGCDGVAIGRAALSTPWVFRDIRALRSFGRTPPPPTWKEIGELLLEFARDLVRLYEERTAIMKMRRVGSNFSACMVGGSQFRQELVRTSTLEELASLVERYFA